MRHLLVFFAVLILDLLVITFSAAAFAAAPSLA